MAKLTLADLVNLQNEPTAVGVINSNSDLIEAAMEKTLSRDGTSPNTMGAKLDMNSNRIMNLPKPVNALEPLRYKDLSDFVGGGTVTNIPEGGTSGMSLVKTADTDYLVGWSNQFPIGYYGSANPTSWNTLYAYGAGSSTPLQAVSSTGQVGVYGASRTSSGTGGANAAIGVIGWGFNDRTAADVAAWGGYFEGRSYVNAYTHGIEVHATNLSGSTVDINPYGMYTTGASSSLWVGTGGSIGPGNPAYNPATGTSNITTPNSASVAIGIVSEGNPTFRKGIVFGSKSIQGSDGTSGYGVAIQMGRGHKISYAASGGSEVASITSTATAASTSLNFYNGGLAVQDGTNTTSVLRVEGSASTTETLLIQARSGGQGPVIQAIGATNVPLILVSSGTGKVYLGADGRAALSITTPSTTPNYLDIAATATGSSPVISATGGDTNININLTPKGTGYVTVNSNLSVGTTPYTGSSGDQAGFTLNKPFYSALTNPNIFVPYPSFTPSAQYSGGSSIVATYNSSAASLGSAFSAQAQNTPTTTSTGALIGVTGGVLNRKNSTDASGLVAYVANTTEPTNSAGRGLFVVGRRVLGQGTSSVRLIEVINESDGDAAGPFVLGDTLPTADRPESAIYVWNMYTNNAPRNGLWVTSAVDYGVIVGYTGTAAHVNIPTHPYSFWDKVSEKFYVTNTGAIFSNSSVTAGSAITPTIYGGSATNSTLTLQSTSSGSSSGDSTTVQGSIINLKNRSGVAVTVNVGAAGSSGGTLTVAGSSSGSSSIITAAAASGTWTIPATTDTFVGKATTDIFTNKTMSGASNTFSNIPASAITSANALTKTDDTNVTLTLGGSPTTALVNAASITVGWTGTLSAARGGFGANISASSGVPLFSSGVATFVGTNGTGNFVRTDSPTLTTSVVVNGSISATGSFISNYGFQIIDRDGLGNFVFYRQSDVNTFWDDANGDYYQYTVATKNHKLIGNFSTTSPVTVTTSSYNVGITDMSIIFNTSATCSVTMPAASSYPGRHLWVKNIAAQTINSAGSDIVPINSATAGSALLSNTAGKWAHLQSNGTAWVIMGNN